MLKDDATIDDLGMAMDVEIDTRTQDAMRGEYGPVSRQAIEEELSSSDEFWDALEQLKIAYYVCDDVSEALISLMKLTESITERIAVETVRSEHNVR